MYTRKKEGVGKNPVSSFLAFFYLKKNYLIETPREL
jgi:hypothetical protein